MDFLKEAVNYCFCSVRVSCGKQAWFSTMQEVVAYCMSVPVPLLKSQSAITELQPEMNHNSC